MTIHWKAVEQNFTVVLVFAGFFFSDFTQFVLLEKLSSLDLTPSGVKGLIKTTLWKMRA